MNVLAALGDILDTKIADVPLFNLFTFILIIIIAFVIGRVIRVNIKRAFKDKVQKTTLASLEKVVYYGIIIIGFLVALPQIGVSLSGLLVAGGILGIVIGFASQTVVSNLISGLFLLIERPIEIGEGVNIDDISGVVKDIKILSTTIRSYDGIYVRIPNDKVFSSAIQNYDIHGARRFIYKVGIRYRDNAEKAITLIMELLEDHPFVLRNPPSQVFVEELGDNSVQLSIRIWAPSSQWYDVYTELLWKIKMALEENGIEIPFPQRVIWMSDEKRVTK
jgi:small-conductance mechanosensitive channel